MKPIKQILCTGAVILAANLTAEAAVAAEKEKSVLANAVVFDIAAQPLGDALRKFGEQTGLQIVLYSEIGKGLSSPSLTGEYQPRAALDRILENTGLRYEYLNSHTVRIFPRQVTPKSGQAAEKDNTVTQGAQSIAWMQLARDSAGTQYDVADAEVVSDSDKNKKKKTSDKNNSVEEMVVEEGRIKPFQDGNADLPRTMDDPQPYYIFNSKEIERSGALTVQDFLRRRLTMDTTYETSAQIISTGDTGLGDNINSEGIPGSNVSSFNLRGLGAGKTLILINGRRVSGINYSRGIAMDERQPDLNGISLSAVDRIEVLPSSASAIYGGGAIGGVINVILKRNFQGGDLRFSYNTPSNSDASTSMVSGTYGLSLEGGKSQLMASGSYTTSKPMILGDRAQFVENGLRYLRGRYIGTVNSDEDSPYNSIDTAFAHNVGTSMGPTGTFATWRGNPNLVLKDGTVLISPLSPGFRVGYVAPGVTSATPMAQRWVAFKPEDFVAVGNGYGRFGRLQPLGVTSEAKAVNASFSRKMSRQLEAFVDFQWNESHGENPYQPQIKFRYQNTNPQSPFQNTIVDFNTTFAEPGLMQSVSQTRTLTAGIKGQFGDWMGELSYSRSENKFDHDYPNLNTLINGRLYLDAIGGLIDMFVDPFTADLNLNRYALPIPVGTTARAEVMSLRLAGPVFQLPWGRPFLSVGLERHMPSRPSGGDMITWVFDGSPLLGFKPRIGSTTTYFANATANYAAYVEGRIPLVTEKNSIPLIRSFDLQLAQRMTRSLAQTGTNSRTVNYNAAGVPDFVLNYPAAVDGIPNSRQASYSSSNGTFAFKYEPVSGVALRASIGTAFIPPTYVQLVPDQTFTPALPTGTMISNDPVTGLSYRTDSVRGGNPELKPQTSETKDVGLIYEPRSEMLKGLRVNLQYYSIGQFDFITTPTVAELLTLPDLASRVKRDPITRQVTQLDLSYINVAERSSAGVDLTFNYDKLTSLGNWSLSLGGTKILYERRQLSASSPMVEYAGFPASGGPVKYKANAGLVWGMKQTTLGWTTNWFGSYRVAGSPGSPDGFINNRAAPWVVQGSYSVPQQMYHHIFASYDFGKDARLKLLSGFGVQLNIENVFNTVPPFDVIQAPFYLSPLGGYQLRTYTLAVKKSF